MYSEQAVTVSRNKGTQETPKNLNRQMAISCPGFTEHVQLTGGSASKMSESNRIRRKAAPSAFIGGTRRHDKRITLNVLKLTKNYQKLTQTYYRLL